MAIITEDYVSFDTAKLLREKGFDAKCNKCYACFADDDIRFLNLKYPKSAQLLSENRYPCITLQMAMKWLREVHKIHIVIGWLTNAKLFFTQIYDMNSGYPKRNPHEYTSYEEAVKESLKYCLENLI